MESRKNKEFKKKGRFHRKKLFKAKPKKSDVESREIEELESKYASIKASDITSFKDFPLSKKTRDGLKNGKYETPTDIQRQSIGFALQGKDILGAAKTGSGKTLAFLIPILEGLYCRRWTKMDGLGALIISPTRELAFQTYEVLQKVGKFHGFSAGLVIGGKGKRDVQNEAQLIHQANIIVCTPGRLLQHMDQTAYFNANNLQFLVLDEADRILDLTFTQDMDAIIENLPQARQTLLYSATQTRDPYALGNRLGVKSPMFVSVHEHAKNSTPDQLVQSYIVCEQHDKMNMLWSFLKKHPHTKMIVFLASCKQVRYVYESFRTMHPGIPVLALHGKMQQYKRMDVYKIFNRHTKCALFTTDVGARGLDFAKVEWVVQLDCPENTDTYTHRVGRTARMEATGRSLLVLRPHESEPMVAQLEKAKIPLKKDNDLDVSRVNRNKLFDIQPKLIVQCTANIHMKEFAQAAFQSYLRTIYLMSNKEVFDVTTLDTDSFASSLGLLVKPRVRWLERETERILKKRDKQKERAKWAEKARNEAKDETEKDSKQDSEQASNDESSSGSEDMDSDSDTEALARSKADMKEKINFGTTEDGEDEGDFFTLKSKDHDLPWDMDTEEPLPPINSSRGKVKTKAATVKKALKKGIVLNKKTVFDDEGNPMLDKLKELEPAADEEDGEEGGIQIEKARKRMAEQDKVDKQLYREKVKQKHREERLKKKEERRNKRKGKDEDDEDEVVAMLPSGDEDEGPDLDFLPDPDKIYGPKDSDSEGDEDEESEDEDEECEYEESEDEESEDEESEEEKPPPVKKARKNVTQEEFVCEGGDLVNDQALALKLLTG